MRRKERQEAKKKRFRAIAEKEIHFTFKVLTLNKKSCHYQHSHIATLLLSSMNIHKNKKKIHFVVVIKVAILFEHHHTERKHQLLY